MALRQEVQAMKLTCEYRVNPVGIETMCPRFSWVLHSSRRNVKQTGYRMIVFDETGTLWDSGKVLSDRSVHNEYEGPELLSRHRYSWKVQVWDELDKASPWSEAAYWEMGLLKLADWEAGWIEPEQQTVSEEKPMNFNDRAKGFVPTDYEKLLPCPLLRKSFSVRQGIKNARIYVTAHGIYTLVLNGLRVGDREFAPEMTAYDHYLQYQTYDVTAMLAVGDNTVGAILADGWYAGRVGLMGDNCQYGNRLALLMQLEIEYVDGSRQKVITDRSFKSATGPFVYSDLFIGEKYDARLEKKDWALPIYDDSDWYTVQEVEYGKHALVADYGEPVRTIRTIKPIQVLVTPRGETVVDLGQVIAGRMRMSVRGAAGTEVTLQHSEVLDEHGNFLNNIIGRHKDQTDHYILKGSEEEIYEPLFTFHGFRYVKVSGYPGTVDAGKFLGIVLSSDLAATGDFVCSDDRINRLQSNIQWSQRGNMLSIPTDCPQRERAGWTGDIQIFAPTASFNMNVGAFLTKWLRNVAMEQREDGQVPIVVPYLKSYQELAAMMSTHSSAGWGDACIIVPWVLYNSYGDIRVLEENYKTMIQWLHYVEHSAANSIKEEDCAAMTGECKERQAYLWNSGFHFGDWLIPSLGISVGGNSAAMMQSSLVTRDLVATCFYAYSTDLLSQIAALLGKDTDAIRYKEMNGKIRNAFAVEYMDGNGRLRAHYQGTYVLALQMDMLPQHSRGKVFGQLIDLIEANDYRLDTGFLSVPYLLDVLCDNGRKDIAYKLLYQTKCPSWLYEVEQGATTIWEAWQAVMPDGKVTNVSYNHYAFGCVGDWLYRRIAGLDKNTAGYKHIIIHPATDCGLTQAAATYESVYGTIASAWKLDGQKTVQRVIIPANTTATVFLPGAILSEVHESGQPIQTMPGLLSAAQRQEAAVLQVGSGSYIFEYSSALGVA